MAAVCRRVCMVTRLALIEGQLALARVMWRARRRSMPSRDFSAWPMPSCVCSAWTLLSTWRPPPPGRWPIECKPPTAHPSAQRRQLREATAALLAAERISPEQIYANALVRETIYDLLSLPGRPPTEDLKELAQRCGAMP